MGHSSAVGSGPPMAPPPSPGSLELPALEDAEVERGVHEPPQLVEVRGLVARGGRGRGVTTHIPEVQQRGHAGTKLKPSYLEFDQSHRRG